VALAIVFLWAPHPFISFNLKDKSKDDKRTASCCCTRKVSFRLVFKAFLFNPCNATMVCLPAEQSERVLTEPCGYYTCGKPCFLCLTISFSYSVVCSGILCWNIHQGTFFCIPPLEYCQRQCVVTSCHQSRHSKWWAFVSLCYCQIISTKMVWAFHLNEGFIWFFPFYCLPGSSLVWVAILGLVLLYIYSLVAFAFFRLSFVPDDFGYCRTLYECAVTIIRFGLVGDIDEVSLFCIICQLLHFLILLQPFEILA
jgi:hypothetical protein